MRRSSEHRPVEIDAADRGRPRRRAARTGGAVASAGLLAAGLCVAAPAPASATSTHPVRPTTVHSTSQLGPGLLHRITPATSPTPAVSGGATANSQSYNWSGYIKTGTGLTRSTASWHIPTVSNRYNGYSSTWVGIDGASSGDGYLIQTGTESDVVNGQPQYYAWYEVITPSNAAPEVRYSSFPVKPGDAMTGSVKKNSTGTWTMTLTDHTIGVTKSHTSNFAGPGRSAEWIQEDTDVDGFISAAPDWHKVTFSGIAVNGANPVLSNAEAVDIYDSTGTQEDHTSKPTAPNNGFSVTWLAPGTPTPAG